MRVLDKGYVELRSWMGGDCSIVDAARVSNECGEGNRSEEDNRRLINYLLREGHRTPFEHCVFTFIVKAPIFVARQWMRHRTWSFNELSRRYSSEEVEMYFPEILYGQSKTRKQGRDTDVVISEEIKKKMLASLHRSIKEYEELISFGVAKEQARIVLPTALYTKFYGTIDLSNLLNFISMRSAPDAQFEIREYANALLELIAPHFPITISVWKELRKE